MKSPILTVYILFCTLVASSALGPKENLFAQEETRTTKNGTKYRVIRNLPYVKGGGERQQLDLYLPQENNKSPLLIWIHGGGWVRGNKSRIPLADHMLDQGYSLASVNYRFTDEAFFPAQLEDCRAAVRWLRASADQYHYDPDRFGAWGCSAGGHLVAMLGTTGQMRQFDVGENLDRSGEVQAVIDIYGPTDLMLGIPASEVSTKLKETRKAFVGKELAGMRERAIAASPTTYVSQESAPFLIIHGEADTTVEIDHSIRFDQALRDAGARSELIAVPDIGHHLKILQEPKVAEKVDLFWDKYLSRENP